MGANNRPTGWAPDRLMNLLSKTDAIDLAWMLARRLQEDDPLRILADEARALSQHVPAFKTAAKGLAAFHAQLKAGHAERCLAPKRNASYLPDGWTRRQDGWRCSPDCKANLPAAVAT